MKNLKFFLVAALCFLGVTSQAFCSLSNVTVTLDKTPAAFFINQTIQSGPSQHDVTIVVNTTDAGFANGLEPWMTVNIVLVSTSNTTPIAGALSVTNVNFTTGTVTFRPSFKFFKSSSEQVRFQVTVSSPNGTALTPTSGTNPTYSSGFNVYDFVQNDPQIVQSPDPNHALFTVDDDINPNPYGFNAVIRSTVATGPEAWMRVKVELIDFNNKKIAGGLSQEDFVPGTDFALGSVNNHPNFSPRFASYSQTMRFLVTISSADGTILIPQTGINPSTTTLVSINAGAPTKFLLLPENTTWIRPSAVGHSSFSFISPYSWVPVALGEQLRIKASLTDRWSNPVDIPNTELQFSATQYLTLPAFNGTAMWILDNGIEGNEFLFNIDAWQVPIPISAVSVNGYTTETIYVSKTGLPKDTIFAGPSPFNPKNGETIRFGFQVDTDMEVNILVVDLFGNKVWQKSAHGTANIMNSSTLWDGANDRGETIAAGVYWVILDKNGEWISKKKFGVIK